MKLITPSRLIALLLAGLFSAGTLAQDTTPPMTALAEIAGIVSSINHFPSDADKARLMVFAENENYPPGLRDMATTVASISHSATAEGREAMARVIADEQVPDSARELARIISDLNHTASDADKAKIEMLFP